MEVAQALYGVTMQEPGVSRLVSVKFNAGERSGGVDRRGGYCCPRGPRWRDLVPA